MIRVLARSAAAVLAGCVFAAGVSMVNATPSPFAQVGDEVPLIAGRVAAIEGRVDIWRAEEDGEGQWDDAQINDVVTVGTALATGSGARAEIRVGPHAFRLSGASSGGFSQLDFAAKVFRLERGVAGAHLAPAQQGEAVVFMVGGVQIELAAPGRYRVDAIDGAPLRVSVFEGQASASYNGSAIPITAGQALVLTQTNLSYAVAGASPFDDWAAARDARYFAAAQAPAAMASNVSPYMTGVEELADHGDWTSDATYGALWIPRAVPVGWAPYRVGRWRWVAPWGWSWVDAAPWGYAPFHYGRWVFFGSRWCWAPGRFVARPIWAPALVGFVGGGGSAAVVGWYPLAPWNAYRPHHRASNTYLTVINQTIINRPPHGVPPTINHGHGSTMVPGPRFRDPVPRVALTAPPPVAQLQPMAPPARPVARTVAYGEADGIRARAGLPSAVPPPRRGPERGTSTSLAQGAPSYSVTPPPPLPGNDPAPLRQPPPMRRVEAAPTPAAPIPSIDIPPPRRAHLPQDQLPPGRARPVPAPAEPAVYPPGSVPLPRAPSAAAPNPRSIPQPPALRQANPPAAGSQPAAPITHRPTPIAPVVADPPRAAPPPRAPAPATTAAPAAAQPSAPEPAQPTRPVSESNGRGKQDVARSRGIER